MTTSPDHRHHGATAAALLCRVISVEAQVQAHRAMDDADVEMAFPNRRRSTHSRAILRDSPTIPETKTGKRG